MMRALAGLLCVSLSLSSCAQDGPAAVAAKPGAQAKKAPNAIEPFIRAGTPEARARDAIRRINNEVTIEWVGAAPFPGFRQLVVGGQVVYVSDDGKYLMQGQVFDTHTDENIGDAPMNAVRRKLMATVPKADRIVFSPPNPKYTISVFTDVECGFCRKFHSEIGEINRQGIAVEYLAFPRMGLGSDDFRKMVSVWCSADRRRALTDAKNDRPIKAVDCKNPVTLEYDVGRRAGLTGTPMIVAADGTALGGYLPPEKLRAALDQLAAGKAVGRSNATEPTAGRGGAGSR